MVSRISNQCSYNMVHNRIFHIHYVSQSYLSYKWYFIYLFITQTIFLMFLWQVEFWLAKNLLLTLHGRRAVYFIRHRKSIIALTYCLCCVFYTAQKINNSSLWPISKDTRIYVFPIIRTYLLMLQHSDKNVISLTV
jgi:hypothetical protein